MALIKWDDTKVNVLSHDTIAAMHEALDRAEEEAKAVVMIGRPGVFTAGFDLKTIRSSVESAGKLFHDGMELFLRQYEFPMPVIVACTGHALGAGAIMLMCSDVCIGADVEAKIGMNETALGMAMPRSVVELARDRLSIRHVQSAIFLARLYSPQQAADVGFIDKVVAQEDLESAALTEAQELAEYLSLRAFRGSRRAVRKPVAESIRAKLNEDARTFTADPS